MPNTVVSNPTPPFQNPPIEPQFFKPSQFFISNISLGVTTTVTTTVNHNYVIGNEIRLLLPSGSGCRQLNEVKGFVLSVPAANQIELSINSSMNVDSFLVSSNPTQPQTVIVGDINTGAVNSSGRSPVSTFIPGSFQNISPL